MNGILLLFYMVLLYIHILVDVYLQSKRCTTVSVEVSKSQHKYVIGPRGSAIAEILQETGVSVEMPPSDTPTDTITLRGPHDKLGQGKQSN
jgi:hypothetical protein